MTDPGIDHAGGDRRTVGELLLDADITSRDALWDNDPDLAKARVRTWGEVLEAAAELWLAIPDRTDDPTMRRIQSLSDGLHRTHRQSTWPGPGEGDAHLEPIATSLARAAELVSARRHPTAPLSAAGHFDSEAARARLMHVVYVCAHGVGASVDQYAQGLQRAVDLRKRIGPGDSLQQARAAKERIGAVENLAGSYLQSRWPLALMGEHRPRPEIGRLEQALARWDVQAHRTMAGPPTVANVLRVAQVQKDISKVTEVVGSVAASRHLIDPDQHENRIRPAMVGLQEAWGRVAADLEPMLGRQRRFDPELLAAASEVHAALREITHQHAGYATPDAIAERVDLVATVDSLHRGLASTVDLAHVVREVLEDPDFTVSARGAQALVGTADFGLVVNVHDVSHHRDISIPHPVRAALAADVDQVIGAGVAADSAGAALQATRIHLSGPATVSGRQHEDRTPPAGPASSPGFGCER